MSGGVAILKIDIVADASKAAAGLGRVSTAADKAGGAAEKSSSKWKTFAGTAARVASAAALGGLVYMFKTGVGEQKDFLSGQAQLANGIKSTGNAAHVSVKGLEDLASSVQDYSGQTDDSIVASEKLLLTFTNVRNEAGKNNDIFNQATKMTADMAAKMGGDASKYAVQLGKALNDPATGLSKLTKIGVTFTDAQKKQVKAMVKAGDTVGAQKVIMAELRKEFGGSAKAAGQTLPGQVERAKRSFEDISQSLVASFMPILTQVGTILLRDVMPAFKTVMGFLTAHKGVFLAIAAALVAVAAGVKVFTFAMKAASVVVQVIKGIGLAIKGIGIAMEFLQANPLILIISAIVLLGIALVMLYKKSATFRKIVQAAFHGVAVAVKAMWTAVKVAFKAIMTVVRVGAKLLYYWYIWPYVTAYKIVVKSIKALIKFLVGAWKAVVSGIKTGLSAVYKTITGAFKGVWTWVYNNVVLKIAHGFNNIGAAIKRGLSDVYRKIIGAFKGTWTWVSTNVVGKISHGFANVGAAIGRGLSNVYRSIIGAFKGTWTWVSTNVVGKIAHGFSNVGAAIGRGLSDVYRAITGAFKGTWTWISENVVGKISHGFSNVATAITNAMSDVFDAIIAPFKSAWTWIKKNVIDKITSGFSAVGGALKSSVNAVIRGWNNLSFTIGGWKLPFPPHTKFPSVTISTPNIPELARGGVVTSPTLAVVGEAGPEIVAPNALIRAIMRDELARQGPTIVVNGALDPDAVARQIDRILTGRARRVGGVQRSGTRTVTA